MKVAKALAQAAVLIGMTFCDTKQALRPGVAPSIHPSGYIALSRQVAHGSSFASVAT